MAEVEKREDETFRKTRLRKPLDEWWLTLIGSETDFGLGIYIYSLRPPFLVFYRGRLTVHLTAGFPEWRDRWHKFIGKRWGKYPKIWSFNLGIKVPDALFFRFERPLGCIDWSLSIQIGPLYFHLSKEREFKWPGKLVNALRGEGDDPKRC